MKTFSLAAICALAACNAAPSAQSVSSVLSDGEACVVGILGAASGTPDIGDLLKCGVTAVDVWNIVTKLEAQSQPIPGTALSPAAVVWHAKLEGVKAQLQARDAGGK